MRGHFFSYSIGEVSPNLIEKERFLLKMGETVKELIIASVPLLVALVGIIPTILSGNKKTREQISSLKEDVDKVEDGIKEVKEALGNHLEDTAAEKATERRTKIVEFADKLCRYDREHKAYFSEEAFEEVEELINKYREYCDSHKNYKNGKGKIAMGYIEEKYKEYKIDNFFSQNM